jgi:hypothetical protein
LREMAWRSTMYACAVVQGPVDVLATPRHVTSTSRNEGRHVADITVCKALPPRRALCR